MRDGIVSSVEGKLRNRSLVNKTTTMLQFTVTKVLLPFEVGNFCKFGQFCKTGSTAGQQFFLRCKHRNAAKKFYETLGVSEDCEDETLRLAFVHLAKQYHPDSGASRANAEKFSEIENAYRQIRRIRQEQKDSEDLERVEEFDIEHTAPQHRHYLEHDVGLGTPSVRQRRHTIEKAQRAAENVMEHRLKKLQAEERNTLVGMDKRKAKDVKTRFGMDRLVEDLIQEAMSRGEFSNLSGMGKPLKNDLNTQNPYVDFVTHKLNQVLIDNGFTPEWIQLSKEIRDETKELKENLAKRRNKLGTNPLSSADLETWENFLNDTKPSVKRINDKIDKYNLLVPILQKQMLRIQLKDFAKEALEREPVKINQADKYYQKADRSAVIDDSGIFSAFFSVFEKKNR